MEYILGNIDEVINNIECENIDFEKIYVTKSAIEKFYNQDIFSQGFVDEDSFEINDESYSNIKGLLNNMLKIPKSENVKNNSLLSSLLNTRFDITIVYNNFSKKFNFVEFTTLRNVLNSSIIKTLNFSKDENFHIEIKKSEEIMKKIFILKNKDSIQIFSFFGFNYEEKFFDYYSNGEIILTNGENFLKIMNKQKFANFKDNSGEIKNFELKPQENILTNNDLIKIDKKIKNLGEGIWEMTMLKTEEILVENFFSLYDDDYCKKFSKRNLFLSKNNLNGNIEINENQFIIYEKKKEVLEYIGNQDDRILIFNEIIFSPYIFYLINKKNKSFLFFTDLETHQLKHGSIDFTNISFISQTNNINNLNTNFGNGNNMDSLNNQNKKKSAIDFFIEGALKQEELNQQKNNPSVVNTQPEPEKYLGNSNLDFLDSTPQQPQPELQQKNNLSDIEANVLTSNNINSNNFFVDVDKINSIDNCENIFYFTSNKQPISKNCKRFFYVIPYTQGESISQEDYIMMNSTSVFFEYDDTKSKEINIFLNLENFEKSIWENFVDNSHKKFNSVSVSISKFNIDFLKEKFFKISYIYIKDLENDFEYNEIKNKIKKYKIDGILNEYK